MARVCLTYVCDGPLVVFINFFCFAARWCPLGSLFFVIVPISINVLPLADFIIYFCFTARWCPCVRSYCKCNDFSPPGGVVPLCAFLLQMK